MNAIVKKSLNSIEAYLNKERKAFYGMFQGKVPGGYCRVMTRDRSYFVQFIIDEDIERVFVEVYPQIMVEKPYRYMVHAYVNEQTSTYKSGRVDIDDDNGELKIRVETSIADHATFHELAQEDDILSNLLDCDMEILHTRIEFLKIIEFMVMGCE